ncbi:MAG: alpha-glucosidase C-terminal domain-containing protein [Oscillospiraceae bacterium]|nr:alpha-glucosidase C-terminal domain-containing protein [Oscillospiraceae bacterium]
MKYWYNDAFFYHIYVTTQCNAPYNNEDYSCLEHRFDKIARWIPHIKDLGCNAVLLSPILQAKSHGYDVTDYFKIDNRFGTNEEFKALVQQFHKNGINVVMDCVFNHCGRDFESFKKLCNGDRSYASWFKGVDFNRQSPYGDYFTYETWAGHFELVKFNLQNPEVKNYLLEASKMWITEFGIDGMRLDAANVLDFDFMRELRTVTTGIRDDFWLMGEVDMGEYTRWVNPQMLHSVTGYKLYKALFSAHNDNNLFELAHTVAQERPDFGLPHFNFADNHDVNRIRSVLNNTANLKNIYSLLFTLPGLPSVYYGSEWGIEGKREKYSDLPLRPYIDFENQPADSFGLIPHIRQCAAARADSRALKYGSYKQVYLEYARPFVFEREFEGEKAVVILNAADTPHTLNLSQHYGGSFRDVLNGNTVDENALSNYTLPANSTAILLQ